MEHTRNSIVYLEQAQKMTHARTAMPLVTAWIDSLREAFGRDLIDGQIRAATRDGLPTFHATEGGHRVGVPMPEGGRSVTAAQMVIEKPKKEGRRG
jgi:hypothetical protein